jgi:hypothetical protein
MSTTIQILQNINQAGITAVSITALLRSDNGLPPTGVSFPIALTLGSPGGGIWPWSGSFTEVGPVPAFYWNPNGPIGQVTFTAGGNGFFYNTILGSGITAGLYSTVLQANGIYGPDNIELWSTRAKTGVFDPSWQMLAWNQADAEIMSEFAKQNYVLPTPIGTQTPGTPIYSSVLQLGQIEATMMGAFLYQAPGLQDAAKGRDGKVTDRVDLARKQLQNLLFLNRGGFQRSSGYSDAPLNIPATVDPSGNPVDPCPPWPVPRWSGYRFVWGNLNSVYGNGLYGIGSGCGCG